MKLLEQILQDKQNRPALIKEFQALIWRDENANDVLSDLAYDLDFYEPDDKLRKEDPSYYGDDRLEEEIKSAVQKLKEQNMQ